MAKLVQRHNEEKRTTKHTGCMPTFLHIFDHQQILPRKRTHTKRLPTSTNDGRSPETVNSGDLNEFSQSSPPEKMNFRRKSPVMQRSSSKSCTELHRLSLDSRATVGNSTVAGGDDNQRRSPSVIARLMGLESVSYSDQNAPQIAGEHALRRSASESRVSRDLVHSKYIDDNNFQLKQLNRSQKQSVKPIVRDDRSNVSNGDSANGEARTSTEFASVNFIKSRSFCDSTDVFEERNQTTVRTHDDFEKNLKMREMDERSSDVSTLKQILEVLQFKGLLHSTTHSNRHNHRSFVYDRNSHSDESEVILMKPWRSSTSKVDYHRSVKDHRGTCRYVKDYRSERIPLRARTSSRNRIESNLKSYNSISKSSLNRSLHHSMINRSPRNQKQMESSAIDSPKQKFIKNVVTEDESSSISDSIVGTPSTTDSEVCGEEKSLLHRCNKLHHSVAEMNCTTESSPGSVTVLPSPVSVLDSGFDEPEPSTPKATPAVDFNDDNDGSTKPSPANSTEHEEFTSNDSDYTYISHIIRSTHHLHAPSNVFFSIEKHLYNNTNNKSNASKRHRKLVFDVVLEILNRHRQFPPSKSLIEDPRALVQHMWSEVQKLREINTSDDMLELIISALKRDLVEYNGWRDYPVEMSEVVLDIERMIFKDLVSEAIIDLIQFYGVCVFLRTRRKLVF